MPVSEPDNIRQIRSYQQTSDLSGRDPALKGGGGDGTFDDMERRVTALEKAFEKVDSKLDTIIKDTSFLRGKVDAMPSTLQLLGFVVAIFVAAGVTRYFGH
ncbi:hypothetical protein [Bradyrhizobium sp. SZCCHNS2015]|uniref:hypothetical protein n=1 Tax=Bradyrhizobium sp. SZCCHNS2015 TaxID=3057305 RepID=UPI0028E3FECA|nr:hypothetical protein [Bradyrhizobium sp. SZCCHNS2015]